MRGGGESIGDVTDDVTWPNDVIAVTSAAGVPPVQLDFRGVCVWHRNPIPLCCGPVDGIAAYSVEAKFEGCAHLLLVWSIGSASQQTGVVSGQWSVAAGSFQICSDRHPSLYSTTRRLCFVGRA